MGSSEKIRPEALLTNSDSSRSLRLGFARSLIAVTFLWSLVIMVVQSISHYDDDKMWSSAVVPAGMCACLCGVGLLGVASEARDLMVPGIVGIGFATLHFLTRVISSITTAVEKGTILPSCFKNQFYRDNKRYCDAMAALDVTTLIVVCVVYSTGTMAVHNLWKKTHKIQKNKIFLSSVPLQRL